MIIMHSIIPTEAPHNTSSYSNEIATIYPDAIKRSKTDSNSTSYLAPTQTESAPALSIRKSSDCSDCNPSCVQLDTHAKHGTKRLPSEAPCSPVSDPHDSWAWETSARNITQVITKPILHSLPSQQQTARALNGPTSAAPKPKRKQIALVKEEEWKLRREEREGTPHVSEIEIVEDFAGLKTRYLRLAGCMVLS